MNESLKRFEYELIDKKNVWIWTLWSASYIHLLTSSTWKKVKSLHISRISTSIVRIWTMKDSVLIERLFSKLFNDVSLNL